MVKLQIDRLIEQAEDDFRNGVPPVTVPPLFNALVGDVQTLRDELEKLEKKRGLRFQFRDFDVMYPLAQHQMNLERELDDFHRRIRELQAENSRLAEEKQKLQYRHEVASQQRDTYVKRVVRLADMVEEQAKDEGLWAIAETATEAYLQAALRRLHAVIEGEES